MSRTRKKVKNRTVTPIMRLALRTRKAQFKAALALSRMTQAEWARKMGTAPEYLSLILSGRRGSPSLDPAIAEFIAKLPNMVGAVPTIPEPAVSAQWEELPSRVDAEQKAS